MYSWNEPVTCFLTQNNASYIFSSLVWLYDANRLVVPSHTLLWDKIGYVILTYFTPAGFMYGDP